MKTIKYVPLLSLLLSTPAVAATPGQLEAAYQILNVADIVETETCLHQGTCVEANPIFGRHPSDARLIGTKVGMGLVHYLIFRKLYEDNNPHIKVFEYVSIAVQGGVVVANLRVYL